jgi:hypothetical protein
MTLDEGGNARNQTVHRGHTNKGCPQHALGGVEFSTAAALAKGCRFALRGRREPEDRRVEQTIPMIFSADETCDVGKEIGPLASADYEPRTTSSLAL